MSEDDDKPNEPKARAASDPEPSDEPDDFSIYVHFDGVKASAPWCIGSYGETGALAESDIADLAARFDIPKPLVQTLSLRLGYCLEEEDAFHNLAEINRGIAIERAAKVLGEAARLARRIEADSKSIEAALAPLDSYFSAGPADRDLLPAAQAHVHRVTETASGLHDAIDRLIKAPGAAADMAPRDRRRVQDNRRWHVVETCCDVWLEAGHRLTYTTVTAGSEAGQRRGRLVAFIQAVVSKVTNPTSELSGETLRKDIDRFRAELAAPDPLWLPPDEG